MTLAIMAVALPFVTDPYSSLGAACLRHGRVVLAQLAKCDSGDELSDHVPADAADSAQAGFFRRHSRRLRHAGRGSQPAAE